MSDRTAKKIAAQRLFLSVAVLALVLFISACGKPHAPEWPATVNSVEGFNEAEVVRVRHGLDVLNELGGKTLVQTDAQSTERSYPISIKRVMAPAEKPTRAGHAIRTAEGCTIELSDFLFENKRGDLLQTVLLHEVGHCAGLQHESENGNIMFHLVYDFANYARPALERFSAQLVSALGAPQK